MIGRPVVRRLTADGLVIRAMSRDVERASRLLPSGCEIVRGDLRDLPSVEAAMRDCQAVYLNLAAPMRLRPPKWEPERDGTQAAIAAARRAGVMRIVRVSALGVDDAADEWWAASHKSQADHAVMESGLDGIILRPTWMMESLATFVLGGAIMRPNLRGAPLRWLAGDDLGRIASWALRAEFSQNRIVYAQGPERIEFLEAIRRFAAAMPKRLRLVPVPITPLRLMALISGKANYLVKLIDMTERHFARLDETPLEPDAPAATMRIEDYVAYVQRTADVPRK